MSTYNEISSICLFRLRKLVADLENSIRLKDDLNKTLSCEIQTLKKDADVQSKTLRELKEILQTHVKPAGPAQLRHRAGRYTLLVSWHQFC